MADQMLSQDVLDQLADEIHAALGSGSTDPVAMALDAVLAAARANGADDDTLSELSALLREAIGNLPQPPSFADIELALSQVIARELAAPGTSMEPSSSVTSAMAV